MPACLGLEHRVMVMGRIRVSVRVTIRVRVRVRSMLRVTTRGQG